MKRKSRPLFIAGVVCMALCGCKKEEAPAPPPPKPAPQAKLPVRPPAAAPLPGVQKQISSAAKAQPANPFDFKSRRDPFKSFIAETPAAPVKTPEVGTHAGSTEALPIQSYDVARFKLSGIVVGLKENRALIVDPTGKGYVVQAGMQIGNNQGRISRITANAVEVVERYKDESGHVKKRTIVLTLAKKR